MSEINVQIRMGPCRLFDFKVYVNLNDNVISLKKAICKIKDHMAIDCMAVMYCGNILNDESRALYTYDLFSGATVFVFQKIKRETYAISEPINEAAMEERIKIFRSLLMSSKMKNLMKALCEPEEINILLYNNPGLVNDPIALTLFQNPELLAAGFNNEILRNLALRHPALIDITLHVPKSAQLLKDETSEDLVPDDNAISTHSLSTVRNTAAQQSQPSTSGTNTSTESMENAPETIQSQLPITEQNLLTQLQMMRNMGFTNQAVNIAALQLSNDFETAVHLVLNGFINPL
ncbi:Ubiquitin-related domain,UBA-like,Ubiquitin-associated domain,Ubiquitin domain [Cinara cedri]|uniref:Ubiquitin-related domain,UBA-like,Ubiquitin-associated domain,Ubiquitin domain n=1 Tax=Cinara cedri TaxID=506608 RepID=A0A5E4MLL3_9HEMI|nr:Ubiquitin-related domain,UBA-like,Ubiquitin-associated domain,Ubiquitin domain [Cinara cedri]